jgi:hypothetical protein
VDDRHVCPHCGAGVTRTDKVIPIRCPLCGESLKGGTAIQPKLAMIDDVLGTDRPFPWSIRREGDR